MRARPVFPAVAGEASITLRIACVAFLLGLAGCATTPTSPTPTASPIAVEPQRDWSDAIIYFVITDRFSDGDTTNNLNVDLDNPGGWHGGDFAGLEAQLDEITSLGATAIWITPVQLQITNPSIVPGIPELGLDFFEHHGFHGYWMDDFNAIEPRLGDEAALKSLVDAAHARGLKVLLDVVYNHSGYGSRYETDPQYRGWVRTREVDCGADRETCQVGGLPDFDTEREDVRRYLLDANISLAERTGIDGFRLDTVWHINHDFWRLHRDETRSRLGQDFFLLGEVWGGDAQVMDQWFEPDEMDAGFDFSFKGSCQGYVLGRGRTIAFSRYLQKRHRVRDGYHLAHYLSTHDEPMSLHELDDDKEKFALCAAVQMAVLGMPVIYYGEEVARGGSVWPTNRKNMPWAPRKVAPGKRDKRNEDMRSYYQKLIAARRTHPALSRGEYVELSTEGDLLVFAKRHTESGDAVIVAINRGTETLSAQVDAPAEWETAAAQDAIGGSTMSVQSNKFTLSVPAVTAQYWVEVPTGG
ncbi:MAG: alpha-amylase family glycosyl hydrolase [Gammaproteobacteria bacterium]|nr:alpha-amylase family glycosyl hydrolase [Gammaproteobacteria bacterium]